MMAAEGSTETSSLILSKGPPPPYEQRSIEETARSRLLDPSYLTSFDETNRKTTVSTSYLDEEAEKSAQRKRAGSRGWKGLTWTLGLSVMAGVLGSSTQFGFNTGVINNPKDAIQESFGNRTHPFTDFEMTVAVAIYAIGGMLGALPAGFIADIVGRKYTMLLNNAVIVVGVVFESLAVHPIMFIVGRFFVGINSGINTVVLPLYISEISPVSLRGSMGVCHQMAVVSTIMLSQIFGLGAVFGRPDNEFYAWRILFAMPLLFAAFQLALLPWLPESPKYLFIKRRKEEAAVKALIRLRGTTDVSIEIQQMQDELAELEGPRVKVSLFQFVSVPFLRRAIVVSIVLHLSQQLGGINGILYYSSDIFKAIGVQHADIATVLSVGLVLVIVTFLTVFLIEWLGRRTLMLYGIGGMAVFFAFFTSMFCFQDGFYGSDPDSAPSTTPPGVLLVFSSLGITALFALGPGAIPWLMVSELFQQEARSWAVSIATIVNWLANFTVGLVFPYILNYLYPYGTVIFVVTCSVLWLHLYFFLPETKGRNVEDITSEFKQKSMNAPSTPTKALATPTTSHPS